MLAIDQPDVRAMAGHIEATIVTLAVALAVWRIGILLIERIFARRFVSARVPRVATFSALSKSLVGLVVLVAGSIELLNIWSVDVVPAVWSAGLVTAALAFGSQAVVRDIVTGFFFLFEDQYDVGDDVELAIAGGPTVTGVVEAMGLRTTKVVDAAGRSVVVPNGTIALVINASRRATLAAFTVVLPWKADALATRDRIADIARAIAAQGGAQDARVVVSLAASTIDDATYRVELRSAGAQAEIARLGLRERLVARLQADGWLPSGRPADAQGARPEERS